MIHAAETAQIQADSRAQPRSEDDRREATALNFAGMLAPFSRPLAQEALAREAPRLEARHDPSSAARGESIESARDERLSVRQAEQGRQRTNEALAESCGLAKPRAGSADAAHANLAAQPHANATPALNDASSATTRATPADLRQSAHSTTTSASQAAAADGAANSAATRAAARPMALLQSLGSAAGPRFVVAGSTRAAAHGPRATPSGATPARSAPQDEFAAQLSRGFSAALRQGGGVVTMRLQPDSLGEIRIRLDLQPGRVSAMIEAGSDEARRLLNDNLTDLRTALEARGLEVSGLEIAPRERHEPLAASQEGRGHGGADTDTGERGGAHWTGAETEGRGAGTRADVSHETGTVGVRAPTVEPMAEPSVEMGGGPSVCLRLDAIA
ncbi:MAG: flagellar hook-length control protein FliK [Phycisphaerales bacterium]